VRAALRGCRRHRGDRGLYTYRPPPVVLDITHHSPCAMVMDALVLLSRLVRPALPLRPAVCAGSPRAATPGGVPGRHPCPPPAAHPNAKALLRHLARNLRITDVARLSSPDAM